MNQYRMNIDGTSVVVDAETPADATEKARREHPDAQIGYPFRVNPAPEVPRRRSRNSRYHLADVDKMGSDGAPPMRRRGRGGRR